MEVCEFGMELYLLLANCKQADDTLDICIEHGRNWDPKEID
jgi:hypothetical protein